MAQDHGKLPWEINQSVPAVIWYIRYQWWKNTEADVQQRLERKAKPRGRR